MELLHRVELSTLSNFHCNKSRYLVTSEVPACRDKSWRKVILCLWFVLWHQSRLKTFFLELLSKKKLFLCSFFGNLFRRTRKENFSVQTSCLCETFFSSSIFDFYFPEPRVKFLNFLFASFSLLFTCTWESFRFFAFEQNFFIYFFNFFLFLLRCNFVSTVWTCHHSDMFRPIKI